MIIALRGKKHSGKTTAAKILRNMLTPAPVQLVGLADPIKQFIGHVFDFDDRTLNGPSELRDLPQDFSEARAWNSYKRACARIVPQLQAWGELLGRDLTSALVPFWAWSAAFGHECANGTISPRRALQTFGTEFGRQALGADVWVDLAFGKARRFEQQAGRSTFTVIHDCRFDNEVRAIRAQGRVIDIVNVEDIAPIPRHHTTHESERPGTERGDWQILNTPSRGREALRQDLRTVVSNLNLGVI